jgi:hypothetical protein
VTRNKPVTNKNTAGGPWRQRDFLLLWGGHTVSEMGSAVTQLVALPAGALVDRRPKRGIMIACDAVCLPC